MGIFSRESARMCEKSNDWLGVIDDCETIVFTLTTVVIIESDDDVVLLLFGRSEAKAFILKGRSGVGAEGTVRRRE